MAIKSETFSSVRLTGQDAARFVRHINEDVPRPLAVAAYRRGQALLGQVLRAQVARGR